MITKIKKTIVSLAALLTLAACSSNPPTTSSFSSEKSYEPIDEEELNAIKPELELEADVYGNIFLPTEVNGANISWKSEDPNAISDTVVGKKKAGVVIRSGEDKSVKMTATIEKNGKRSIYEQTLNVRGLAKQLTDDDYEGYLFGHFIGEGGANQEQIYFALSEGGLRFKDMNKGTPVLTSTVGEKGVRDPYICRSPEGDRFFLIATDLSIFNRGGWRINAQGYYDPSTTGSHNLVLWQSKDLINWGEPSLLPVAPENAGMAWAPEMVFDDVTGEYIVFFASSIMNPETKYKDKPNAIYYVSTRDFKHFSDTKILIDNQTDPDGKAREIIDTTILKVGDTYYSASKDGDNREANGGIRIMKTQDLLSPESWEKVLDLDELGLDLTGQSVRSLDNGTLEGPEFFQYNKNDRANPDVPEIGLMADQYAANQGYLPLKTTNLEDRDNGSGSWSILSKSDYSFDRLKKRHGTILRITKAEIDAIKDAFPA